MIYSECQTLKRGGRKRFLGIKQCIYLQFASPKKNAQITSMTTAMCRSPYTKIVLRCKTTKSSTACGISEPKTTPNLECCRTKNVFVFHTDRETTGWSCYWPFGTRKSNFPFRLQPVHYVDYCKWTSVNGVNSSFGRICFVPVDSGKSVWKTEQWKIARNPTNNPRTAAK